MPNSFAYIVLFSWPVVTFFIFRALPRAQAVIVSIVAGYLLLPSRTGLNLPLLPDLNKDLMPALSALVMALFVPNVPNPRRIKAGYDGRITSAFSNSRDEYTNNKEIRKKEKYTKNQYNIIINRFVPIKTGKNFEKIFIFLLFFTPLITASTNGESFLSAGMYFKGLSWYDASSIILSNIVMILPYLIGRKYLGEQRHHAYILAIICLSGLIYTLPALFEIRMSPQLHKTIYGFFQHSFIQHMRAGGFRPLVFLGHALELGIFLAISSLAVVLLWRQKGNNVRWMFAGVWLLGTLLLCKTTGALAIALLLLPVAFLFSVKWQLVLASAIATIFVLYPVMRGAGLIPVEAVVSEIAAIAPKRAESLQFRVNNEEILLARARAKPIAGWGGYSRSRVFDQQTGDDISITDGVWIIVFGTSGWLGYIAVFGLLVMPIFLLTRYRRQLEISMATSGLCLILAANMIDMVPNSSLTPITWLIAGALMGRVVTSQDSHQPIGADRNNSGRNRFAGRTSLSSRRDVRNRA